MKKMYIKFLGMIITSSILMYMVMYLNTYEISHVFLAK